VLVPELPADYATIMGHIKSKEEWRKLYQVDDVRYTHELETILEDMVEGKTTKIYLMEGPNSDSGKTYELAPKFESKVDGTSRRLYSVSHLCRVQSYQVTD